MISSDTFHLCRSQGVLQYEYMLEWKRRRLERLKLVGVAGLEMLIIRCMLSSLRYVRTSVLVVRVHPQTTDS